MSLLDKRKAPGGRPERNIIQRPEILARLTSLLSLRQAHVAPTLNDGVQSVVVLADISKDTVRAEAQLRRGVAFTSQVAQVGLNCWLGMYNKRQSELAADDAALSIDKRRQERDVLIHGVSFGNAGGVTTNSVNVISVEKGRFLGVPAVAEPDVVFIEPQVGVNRPTTCSQRALQGVGTGFIPGGSIIALIDTGVNDTWMWNAPANFFLPPGWTFWAFAQSFNYDMDLFIDMSEILPTANF